MSWFYNSYSGELTSASGVDAIAYEAAIHTGTGWHELPIPASDSATQAEAYVDANFKGSTPPTTSVSQGLGNAATDNPITNAASKAFDYTIEASGFNSKNFVVRVLKVIIGGVLLLSGIIHMTGVDSDVLSKVPVIPA